MKDTPDGDRIRLQQTFPQQQQMQQQQQSMTRHQSQGEIAARLSEIRDSIRAEM